MLTFTLKDLPLDRFYDRAAIAKTPSFGVQESCMCPFMYLAHYNQVSNDEGRKTLRTQGLEPDLIRLSAGHCDAGEVIETFRYALS